MSRSALSAKVFAIYLFILGPLLIIVPNFLLSIFGIAPTTEVWIRVVGVIAGMLGVYAWVGARHENKPFLEASVYTRLLVFVAFAAFAVLKLASPVLVLFGLADLAGALWTHVSLKADARAVEGLGIPAKN